MTRIAESEVEDAALAWLEELGWSVAYGPDIAPETPDAERGDYGEIGKIQKTARMGESPPSVYCRSIPITLSRSNALTNTVASVPGFSCENYRRSRSCRSMR